MTRAGRNATLRFVSPYFPYAGHVGIDGKTLQDARQRAGLSQAELGAMLNVTARTIRAWESTEVKPYAINRVGSLDVLWKEPDSRSTDRYSEMSDAALLAELNRLLGIIGQRLADRSPAESYVSPNEALSESAQTVNAVNNETGSNAPGTTAERDEGPHKSGRRIRGRGPA